jgi:MFS family permease
MVAQLFSTAGGYELSAQDTGDVASYKSTFAIRNVRLFIAFRVFFNARFYYPVFTILFLDFGLTLEQFALLNAAWAAAIVLLEVPSGALADTFGRRNLLVVTGVLMVIEIALLCLVPLGNSGLLFAVFLVNRVLSGAAEAAASGADEAIAYDSLKNEGDAHDWPRVLEKQMRMQSIGYIGAMSIGAAVYDPDLMQHAANALGLKIHLTQSITLRFPLYLTLIFAVITLLTTLRMQEQLLPDPACGSAEQCSRSTFQAFKLTLQAGSWILRTPFALVIILAGLIFDNCIRMVITLCSQYYRLISLPEASFGLIGSGLAVLGLVLPRLAHKMVYRHSPAFNLGSMTVLTFLGLIGMTFFIPIIGLLPVALLSAVMYLGRFFLSHYLHRITASHQRATVLSFKGLSFNLAYGLIGILYSILLAFLKPQIAASMPDINRINLENAVFIESMGWFPWYFLLTLIALLTVAHWQLQHTTEYKTPG